MTPVESFDYLAQHEVLRGEIEAAIDRVISSGRLILGEEVERFEEGFASFLGAGRCVGVASGTYAMVLGLRALGVDAEDEVLTVANTAVATVSAIRQVGATPVFCDVDPATGLMDLDAVEERIGARTRAVLPVHLYGNVVDVAGLREIIGARPIRILEDCAQAHGATIRGRMAGTLGDVAAFSFYPTKNLGAYGDAGLCASRAPELVALMRSLRQYGFEGAVCAEREGQNSRLDELQAAILGAKLPHLPRFLERRRRIGDRYDERLGGVVPRLLAGAGVEHARHQYVIRSEERDALREALAGRGIATGVHYPHPIHLMPAYAFLGHAAGSLPHSEALAREVVSLPLYPELSDGEVDRVADAVTEWVGGL